MSSSPFSEIVTLFFLVMLSARFISLDPLSNEEEDDDDDDEGEEEEEVAC